MTTFPSSLNRKRHAPGGQHAAPTLVPPKYAGHDFIQPTEWDEYQPDMSGNSYIDPIEIHEPCDADAPTCASDIDCRALTEPTMASTPAINGESIQWSWSGQLTPQERASIADYMQRIGATVHHHPGCVSSHYNHPQLWICVCLLERPGAYSSITIRDYSRYTGPLPTSQILSIMGGAA